MAPNPNVVGGLDLGALAAQGTAESATRSQGSQNAMSSYLQSMLSEQSGLLESREEAQGRDQAFLRAQAMLEEALARREAALQEAQARAEMAFGEQQGNANRQHTAGQNDRDRAVAAAEAQARAAAQRAEADDWYAKQRYQTDENIRQATILGAMDRKYQEEDRRRALRDEQPKLSDFGKDEINAYRGQALLNSGHKSKGGWLLEGATRGRVKQALEAAQGDPASAIYLLRQQGVNDEMASIALWQLGIGK